MSIDGEGILESDLAHDVYNEILDLYDVGLDYPQIQERISTYEDSSMDDLDLEIYLTAAAKAYWETGLLTAELLARVQAVIESEKGLELWREAGGTEQDCAARKRVLDRFLKQITVPKAKPRPRKKYAKIKDKLFQVGDCLLLRDGDRTHKGIVCQINEYRGDCDYAILVLEDGTEPNVPSFKRANFVGRRIPCSSAIPGVSGERGFIYGPSVLRPEHRMILREGIVFEIIGRVSLDLSQYMMGSFGGVLTKQHVLEEFRRIHDDRTVFHDDLIPLAELLRQ
jgi:hypothetical protein